MVSREQAVLMDHDVGIVGGGITGSATAYYLARAGRRVVLFDEYDLNTQASGRNAGSLHGQIQFEPYRVNGQKWTLDFLPALRFLRDSLDIWATLGNELDADLEVSTKGGLLVADSDEEAEQVAAKAALEVENGFSAEMVSGAQLRRLAPYLSQRIVAAEYCPVEGKANSLLAAPAFAAAARREGATIHTGTRVRSVEPTAGGGFTISTSDSTLRCGQVVLAAGAALPRLGGPLGFNLPIIDQPMQVHATEPVAPVVPHLVYYAGDRLTFKQARAGTLLIGGGWPASVDDATGHPTVSAQSMRANLKVALRVAPWLSGVHVIRAWAGIGNATPDLRPLIGESATAPGAFVGMFPHMGLTAGPLMGRTLTALVLGADPGRDLRPFAHDRFVTPDTPQPVTG